MWKSDRRGELDVLKMICVNMCIILLIFAVSLKNKPVNIETNTYVQYIEGSDEEKEIKAPIAGVVEVQYNYLSDFSLSEDTSTEDVVDVTVTDSQHDFEYYPESRYSIDWSDNDKYLLAKIAQCEDRKSVV